MSPTTTAGSSLSTCAVILAAASQWGDGIAVAVAAQRATGFPLNVTPDELPAEFALRQQHAEGVWLAYDDGRCVGHALVSLVGPDLPKWSLATDPAVRHAHDAGRLAEFGSLAVHPNHHGHGIARAIKIACLDWMTEQGLLGCASVWNDSAGSQRLARQYGRAVGTHPVVPSTLFVYDRWPASRPADR